MIATRRNPDRNKQLAQIHIAKNQLGLDDDAYRDMLWTVARVRSAGDLDAAGRQAVIDHLKGRGFKVRRQKRPVPAPDRERMVAKIRAILIEKKRPDSYVDAMARRMFGVERFEWCKPSDLHKLVAALSYDQKRGKSK